MDADVFLSLLNPPAQSTSAAKTSDPEPIGASLRWAIGFDDDSDPHLEIQILPTGAKNLSKKAFTADNSVSVLLGSFPIQADMFTNSFARGIIPIFFSPLQHLAHLHLVANPEKAKEAVAGVNTRFLKMEHLSLDAAIAYLKARKPRAAKGIPIFPAPAGGRKRGRAAAQDIPESGHVHTQ